MSLLSFCMIQLSLLLPSNVDDRAFREVLGLSGLRIFSSLTAYIIAQVVDIQLYSLIKSWTGERFLWVRNNGSTCISQLIDTIVIDIIFLYWGLGLSMNIVFPIMVLSYAYKAFFSFAATPLFYVCVHLFRRNWSANYSQKLATQR